MDEFKPMELLDNQPTEGTDNDCEQPDTSAEDIENPVVESTPCDTPADDVVDKLNSLIVSQQQIFEKIEALNSVFDTKIMHSNNTDKIVDQMHKELQKYKEDMYAQLVRPILLDIIEVRDSIMRMTATYLAKPEGEQDIPNKVFADYSYDLQDILEKNNVEIYRSADGDTCVPIRQRAIKKVTTNDETLHGKVAQSLSCGYNYKEKTISAEKVYVYSYEETIIENENSEVSKNV